MRHVLLKAACILPKFALCLGWRVKHNIVWTEADMEGLLQLTQ